jgi:hypothetical protein
MPFVKEIQSRGVIVDLDKKGSVNIEASPLTAGDVAQAIEKAKP